MYDAVAKAAPSTLLIRDQSPEPFQSMSCPDNIATLHDNLRRAYGGCKENASA
jgi:hypothetical protein